MWTRRQWHHSSWIIQTRMGNPIGATVGRPHHLDGGHQYSTLTSEEAVQAAICNKIKQEPRSTGRLSAMLRRVIFATAASFALAGSGFAQSQMPFALDW